MKLLVVIVVILDLTIVKSQPTTEVDQSNICFPGEKDAIQKLQQELQYTKSSLQATKQVLEDVLVTLEEFKNKTVLLEKKLEDTQSVQQEFQRKDELLNTKLGVLENRTEGVDRTKGDLQELQIKNGLLERRLGALENETQDLWKALWNPHPNCSSYNELNDAIRKVGHCTGSHCGWTCDDDMNNKWYRFTGDAGTQMATSCPSTWTCGAAAPMWALDPHPTGYNDETIVNVCAHWDDNCCKWSTNITVVRCRGFYIYQLPDAPACNLRYCGI